MSEKGFIINTFIQFSDFFTEPVDICSIHKFLFQLLFVVPLRLVLSIIILVSHLTKAYDFGLDKDAVVKEFMHIITQVSLQDFLQEFWPLLVLQVILMGLFHWYINRKR